ncbi:MAG: phosphonate C-P lyase system protein PhnG [Bacteroidota bacterium]
MDIDYVLVEGDLDRLKTYVESLEKEYHIIITKQPFIGLTMIKAHDSVEHQPFYLGEALITETEVSIEDKVGLGICIGDQPTRSYCAAVIDAAMQLEDDKLPEIMDFLQKESFEIYEREKEHNHQIQKTKVDFKLMEQD